MSFWTYANPKKFTDTVTPMIPWIFAAAGLCLATSLIWGFFFTPDDYRQGAIVKIIYLHVPSAMMGINAWFMMLVTSLIWLVRRHHVSALAAKAAAPIGMVMVLIAIGTGMLWGKPLWGTYWAWDPRLTSFLILLLFYLGYMALWSAVEDPDTAADLTSVLCIVGSVFAMLSRYAVNFWNQGLHQPASLSLDAETHVAPVFWYPLLVAIAGFVLLFIGLVFLRTRTEIARRRTRALDARAQAALAV